MHRRWDLEECIFHQGKTTWQLQHCFGHDPAMIEALVGAQLIAITLWNWWTERGTVSPASRRMARRTGRGWRLPVGVDADHMVRAMATATGISREAMGGT